MARVVGVAFKDREGPIDLLEQHDAGKFVGKGHFAQRKRGIGGLADFVREAIGRTNGEDQGLGAAVLMVLEELGEFLGGELAASGVEENDGVGWAGGGFFAEFEESGFVREGETLDVGVAGDSLEVFGGERLDGGVFGFADPSDF